MSWVSENKFLTGFGVVMLGGIGTLGWFMWSAMGNYETAAGEFDTAVNALKRVEGTKPYPNKAHVDELIAQKQEVTEKLDALQKDLKGRVLGVEPLTKTAFQDKLKESVARVTAKAAAKKTVSLADKQEKFYMGYAKYQSSPPDDAAAPVLGRQLRAIELIMDVLINAGGVDLKKLDREELPEEHGAQRSRTSAPGGRRNPGRDSGGESSGHRLVEKSGVSVKIQTSDKSLQQILNAIASHKQQFFIIRSISVLNERTESPQKVAVAAGFAPPVGVPEGAAPPDPAAAPGAPPATPPVTPAAPGVAPATPPAVAPVPDPAATPVRQGSLGYAFGTEKIEATIEIEILDFAEPDARPEKPAKGKAK